MDEPRNDEWGDSDTPWSRRTPREPAPGPQQGSGETPRPQSMNPPMNQPMSQPMSQPTGPPPGVPWMPPPAVQVPDHQGLAVTALVLSLCSILGLVPAAVAMVQSSAVNSRLRHGDVLGAQLASSRVRVWSFVAIAVSLLLYAMVWINEMTA